MNVRPLIGLAVALGLTGCTGASDLAESEPAVNSSPPAPSTAAAPSIPRSGSDVVHDLTTGIESALPDAIQALEGSNYELSPDGTKLTFDAIIDGYHQVMVASRNGTWVRQVTHGTREASNPRWSPSGDRLAYECGRTILVTTLPRGRTIRLTRRDGLLRQPSFMADGRRVVFTRITPAHTDLWTAPSRGGRSTPLVADAAWGVPSPDGTAIAFHRIQGSIEISSRGPYQRGLTLIHMDGSQRRPLNGPRGWMMAPIDWSYQRPRWSPNGTMIAYDSGLPHADWVKVVRVSDGRVIREFEGASPNWLDGHTVIIER